ncbi:glycoside hydrolase family 3 protein [Colwellia sp. BRX8-4]|uniref:glycoside hydrolase family 3 protein n=1 Tax=Colwellia sp. BRX8-4 TaxID=2759836 RepID=UPI0015F648E7|nr:glycoside hydrolase family 3 protein [Colwellia sp. BRX8-4]MBA6364278.1 glycoside hydrolase family 3 protein [Colwellia sp. BRX8-8]MBA6370584.1 glycoside hydrolase family 3 protein [Colwellia sp. BRX8-4]
MQPLLSQPSIKEQVDELMSKMTLAQKIGQMTQAERLSCTPDDVRKYHLGSVLSGAGSLPENNDLNSWLKTTDSYWQASMVSDENHLAIPLLYGVDAIHGHNNLKGATIFPHNIGLGAAADADLIARIAQVTRKEVLASGVDWVFAPNLAVAQNNQWGRSYESYAQTPELINQYASEIINGLHGKLAGEGVIACVKHWVGDGATTHGIDQGDANISWQELNNTHISPYISALKAGAMTVMASFNSWNGNKCHGHKYLLTDVLKQQLNFSGFIVSDMNGIDYLCDDFYLSVAQGVNAGIDMFMLPENWQQFIHHLHNHVELGTVPISRVNDAVRRILSVKFASGLFNSPRPSERIWANDVSFGASAHRNIAREAVRKSLVLLKNKKNILPLKKQARILVTGKNADNIGHQCGGFTIDWQGVSGNDQFEGATSVWQGISAVAPNAVLRRDSDVSAISAKDHDIAVVVIGEYPYAEGHGDIRDCENLIIEAGSQINGQVNISAPYGNSLALKQLHPEDYLLIKDISDKGIPLVVILISGRTLIINDELDKSAAFIAAWLPGSEGQGVSDMLFGEFNFQGKLSFSWPKKTSAEKKKNNTKPLFPIGYGLRYKK